MPGPIGPEARDGRREGPMGGREKPWNLDPLAKAGGRPGDRLDRTAPRDTRPWPLVTSTIVDGEFVPLPRTYPLYQLGYPETRPKADGRRISIEIAAPNIKPSYLTPAHPDLSPAQIRVGEYVHEPTPKEIIDWATKLPKEIWEAIEERTYVSLNVFKMSIAEGSTEFNTRLVSSVKKAIQQRGRLTVSPKEFAEKAKKTAVGLKDAVKHLPQNLADTVTLMYLRYQNDQSYRQRVFLGGVSLALARELVDCNRLPPIPFPNSSGNPSDTAPLPSGFTRPTASPTPNPSPTSEAGASTTSPDNIYGPTATPIGQLDSVRAKNQIGVDKYKQAIAQLSRPANSQIEIKFLSPDRQYILDLSYILTDANGPLSTQDIGNGQIQLGGVENANLYFYDGYVGQLRQFQIDRPDPSLGRVTGVVFDQWKGQIIYSFENGTNLTVSLQGDNAGKIIPTPTPSPPPTLGLPETPTLTVDKQLDLDLAQNASKVRFDSPEKNQAVLGDLKAVLPWLQTTFAKFAASNRPDPRINPLLDQIDAKYAKNPAYFDLSLAVARSLDPINILGSPRFVGVEPLQPGRGVALCYWNYNWTPRKFTVEVDPREFFGSGHYSSSAAETGARRGCLAKELAANILFDGLRKGSTEVAVEHMSDLFAVLYMMDYSNSFNITDPGLLDFINRQRNYTVDWEYTLK